ncbi:hypothetical protein GGI35DRAFT_6783 [Trichoderma velutinum]
MSNDRQNEPFLMEVTCVFTREEAKATLEQIFELFENDRHDSVTEEMAKGIELKHTKVLSRRDKSYLRMWAYSVGDYRVLRLLESSPDDLDSYSWTEMIENPMPELFYVKREHTTSTDAKNPLLEKEDYQLLQSKFVQLHAMVEDNKKRASDSHLHMQIRLAELSEEVSVIKRDLASVKQQNAEIIQLLKRVPGQDETQKETEDPVFTRLRKDRESQPYHFRR